MCPVSMPGQSSGGLLSRALLAGVQTLHHLSGRQLGNMAQSIWAAVTKYLHLCNLVMTEITAHTQFWRLGSPGSRCQRFGVLWMAPSVSSHGRKSSKAPLGLFLRAQIPIIRWGPHGLITSRNEGLTSEHPHLGG
jgi:hypothetical protein